MTLRTCIKSNAYIRDRILESEPCDLSPLFRYFNLIKFIKFVKFIKFIKFIEFIV